MSEQQQNLMRLPQTDVQVFSPEDVKSQIHLIQDIMKSVMRENEHYGKIPGTHKPTLLKAGAEKLGLTFRLAPYFEGENSPINLTNNHVKYIIKCTLRHIQTDQVWGQGVGSCSSMESKYRYRWIDTTDKPEKEEAAELKAKGFGKWKKYGNDWIWQKRIENQDIADVDNTILKMAKKRAHVDAMLNATAASDIFTQDVEDMDLNGKSEPEKNKQVPKQQPNNGKDKNLVGKEIIIGNMLMAIAEQNTEQAASILQSITKSDDGKHKGLRSPKEIKSLKQANLIINKIKEEYSRYDWDDFIETGELVDLPAIVAEPLSMDANGLENKIESDGLPF